MSEMLTPEQLSEYLCRPTGTLANWRHKGIGPSYIKAGGRVLYRRVEVERWLRQQERQTANGMPAPAA
jgi:hypothetical protein